MKATTHILYFLLFAVSVKFIFSDSNPIFGIMFLITLSEKIMYFLQERIHFELKLVCIIRILLIADREVTKMNFTFISTNASNC
jgi:hypothetical protein